MKKSNLLSKGEMKKVMGGNAPLVGCYVKCTTTYEFLTIDDYSRSRSAWSPVPDCSGESQSICFNAAASGCFCFDGPRGGGPIE